MNSPLADINLIPFVMIGLLGSVHCVGMCGGIVSALSIAAPTNTSTKASFPIPVVASAKKIALQRAAFGVLAYNAGRISSYMLAGVIAGGIAQGVRTISFVASLQIGGYWLANMMLLVLGLYLMDVWRGLTHLEAIGQFVWRRVQPITKRFLPMDHPVKAFALGSLWGWLPCGMVYSVLLTAMLTGSALSGAMVMLAFGLGTLPTLMTMGLLGTRFKFLMQDHRVRMVSGAMVLAFGLLGIARASNSMSLGWLDAVCITPVLYR